MKEEQGFIELQKETRLNYSPLVQGKTLRNNLFHDLNIGYRDYSQAPDYFVADKGKSFRRLENARAGKSFFYF